MNATWTLVAGWLALSGLVGFVLMGLDKHSAQASGRRTPEKTFFTLALIGGAFGILIGSGAFHHKNRKVSFMAVVLICAIAWLAGLSELSRFAGFP
jgi:uncharacterized membrane protein YsdA (DUF1294 family)